jgi:hypothetical protein
MIGVAQLGAVVEGSFDPLHGFDRGRTSEGRLKFVFPGLEVLGLGQFLVDVLNPTEILEPKLVNLPTAQTHRSVFFPRGPEPAFEQLLKNGL